MLFLSLASFFNFSAKKTKTAPADSHVYFWRENSNIFTLKYVNVPNNNVVKEKTFYVIFKHCAVFLMEIFFKQKPQKTLLFAAVFVTVLLDLPSVVFFATRNSNHPSPSI